MEKQFGHIIREHPDALERVFEDVDDYVHYQTEVVTHHIDNIYKGLSKKQFLSNPLCFDLSMVKLTVFLLQSSLRRIFKYFM